MKTRNFYYIVLLLVCFHSSEAATYYSRQTGNWSSSSSWSTSSCTGTSAGSTPGAADSVVICSSRTITVSSNVNVRSITISSGGTLQCGNSNSFVATVNSAGFFTIQSGGTYIHNTTQVASTSIFNGTENFVTGSTVRINRWSSTSTPLITGINSSFGHLILDYNTGSLWNNNGLSSTRSISGNLTVTANCKTFLDNSNTDISMNVGGKLYVYGELHVKDIGNGNTTLTVGDSLIVSGSSAYFIGVQDGNGDFTFNGQNVNLTGQGRIRLIQDGNGNLFFNFNNFNHLSSEFYGIFNDESSNAGTATFNGNNITYSDNYFIFHYGCNTENDTLILNLTGSLDVNFASILVPMDDYFSMIRMVSFGGTPNTLALNVTIAGDMYIHGNAGDFFVSSQAAGNESITIHGNLTVSEGTNYFNGILGQNTNGHDVFFNVGGATIINGGILILSTISGTVNATFVGNTTISNGSLIFKESTGSAIVNFNSPFLMSGGTLFMHNDTSVSNDIITMNIKSNFTHNGGVISFSTCTKPGGATNILNLSGSSVSLGPAGNITRALAGTGSVFGQLNYSRLGTMSYTRVNGHDIQQVKQAITNITRLNCNSNVQIASSAIAGTDYMTVNSGCILNLNGNQIFSNNLAAQSGLSILSAGRLRTSHVNGLYNNTSFAAISNVGNMNYFLDPGSIVEIAGTSTKVLTGIGLGLATGTQHKYGILEINHTGAANTTYVYPTASPSVSSVFIRSQLILLSGELNLVNSATPVANGGRTITIENNAANAISRVNGYIKSEVQDFSGKVVWQIGNGTGVYTIPFGYDNANYIPMSLNILTPPIGNATLATYHTPPTNLPWPPSVNNLFSGAGLIPDNRDATLDRYWNVSYSGNGVANMTLRFLTTEMPIPPYNVISELRAHRYNTLSNLWEAYIYGQLAGTGFITVPSIPSPGIWSASSIQSPLPVELISFTASKMESEVLLKWTTATEKDNDYFIVERTADFNTIDEIGRVKGFGNSSISQHYSLLDKNPMKGLSYYRLRQVDINGDTHYSDWISIRFTSHSSFSVYPNPANDYIYFDLQNSDQLSEIRITDISGSVVYESKNYNIHGADISDLANGTYFIQLVNDGEVSTSTFMINR